MSVKITDQCVTCGACLWECPTEAISPGAMRPVVEPDTCTECYGSFGESQCIVVCPVNAIELDQAETVEQLAEKFRQLRPNQEPQDSWIWVRLGTPT